jgi:DNA ligase D-like protein (predicted 3'-phosphoesterase)
MGLSNYRPHRRTGRPRGRRAGNSGPCFVIQHHVAQENFYDFRLEIDGVLVSWAIPRGPAVNPQEQRMARRTEDHPLQQAGVDGTIDDDDDDDDGTGATVVWDHGTYANKTAHQMTTCLGRGHLSFLLNGEKLRGDYALTRVREGEEETWLLVKRRDDEADAENRLNGSR